MASQMYPSFQHIGALTTLDSNTKITQTPSTYKKVRFVPTTRITSATTIRSKYKPRYVRTMEEQSYHTLLAGAPFATFQEDLAILARGPSVATPSATANMSLRRDIFPPIATPTTPPVTMARGEQLIPIAEAVSTDSRTPPSTPTKKTYRGSALDKDLPSKPILRAVESPERRGLVDALDNDQLTLSHPVIDPELAFLSSDSDSSDDESPGSFKKTPSLSTPSTIGKVETGTAVEGKVGNAKTVSSLPVRTGNYGSPALDRIRYLSSMPSNSSLNRRLDRLGTGPILRKTSDCHEVIMGPTPHPPRTSSLPTPVKSIGQIGGAARLSRPTAASAARAAEAKKSMLNPGKTVLNKASSSKLSIFSKKSATSVTPSNKLGHVGPTISSSKTSLNTSSTTSSLKKGFKSRVSGFFSGRRLNTGNSKTEDEGFATIAEAEYDNDLEATDMSANKRTSLLLTTFHNSSMREGEDRANLSDKERNCDEYTVRGSDNGSIRSGKSIVRSDDIRGEANQFMGEVVDREHTAKDQARRNVYDRGMTRAVEVAGQRGALARDSTLSRTNRDDEDPPTPPPRRDGLTGHYVEEENVENNVAEETNAAVESRTVEDIRAIYDPAGMSENDYDRFLSNQLNIAETNLNQAIAQASRARLNTEAAQRVSDVLQALGRSIITTRQALMMNVEFRAATVNLIQYNTTRSELARRAVMDVVDG